MSDQPTIVLLKAQVDQNEAKLGVDALNQIQAAIQGVQKDLLAINSDAANVSSTFQRLDEASKVIGRDSAIQDLAAQFVELGKETGDYESQLLNLRDALREIGASSDEIDKATTAFAELADEAKTADEEASKVRFGPEGLRRTGSALTQLGLGVVGEPVRQAGDIAQVVKELGQLGDVAKALPGIIAETTVSIGGMELALGPLLLALAPIAAAVGGVVLVLKLLADQAQKAADETKQEYDAEKKTWDQREQNRRTAESLTSTQNDKNIQVTAQDIQDANAHLLFLQGQFAQTQQQYGDLGSSFNPADRSRLGAIGKQQQQDILDYIKHINDLNDQFKNQTQDLPPLIKAHEDAALALEDEKKAQDARNAAAEQGIQQAQRDAQLLATGTSAGVASTIQQIQAEMQAINDAISKGGLDQAEIDKLAARYHELNLEEQDLTNHIQPLVDAREAEKKAIDETKSAIDSLQNKYDSTSKEVTNLSSQMAQEVKDHSQKVVQELQDQQRQEDRAAVEADYTARINEAKRAEAVQKVRDDATAADQQALDKSNAAKATATQNFFDSVQKIWQSYYDQEKQSTDRFNLDRLHTIEKAQMDLKQLAAQGDVAGFVNRSNQAKDALKTQKENFDLDEQQRQASLDKQLSAAQDSYTKQLDALQKSFDDEKAVRDAAADQRIKDIQAQGEAANSESARLEQELNDLRAQWRREDLERQRQQEEQAWDDRLRSESQHLAELQKQEDEFYAQLAAAVSSYLNQIQVNEIAGALQDPSSAFDYTGHAGGGDMTEGWNKLGEGGPEWVWKEGDRATVYPNQGDGAPGGGGNIYHFEVHNTVGDVPTKELLDEYQDTTIAGFQKALEQSRGLGQR